MQAQRIVGPTWTNRTAMRDFATVLLFRAVKYLDQLPCRVQFFGFERYPAGHYGIFVESALSHALQAQTQFLVRELSPG